MSLWVKICGNTNLADAQLAVDAGADALGFVFATSPRRVTAVQVAAIVSQLPQAVEKIGVFVDTPYAEILDAVRIAGLTGVQLPSPGNRPRRPLVSQLRQALGPAFRILRVLHFRADTAHQAAGIFDDPNVDALLLDSQTATAVGGTGIAFDWQKARSTLPGAETSTGRIVVAGGLHPGNVAEAISILRPWGVDVVSGVEAAPGRKDPDKVRAFIANARRTRGA